MSALARIPTLTERELLGWWAWVIRDRMAPERPGEHAAILKRDKQLGGILPVNKVKIRRRK